MKHKRSLYISTRLREKQIDIKVYVDEFIYICMYIYIMKKYLSV